MIQNLDAILDAEIVVVEPHSDDAWLSCGQHLLDWRGHKKVTILTVYGNRRRLEEAARFADWVGARHATTALPEGDLGLSEDWETEIPPGALDALHEIPALVVGPLGLRHPEHIAVVAALGSRRDVAYVEMPYALTQKNAPEVTAAASGRPVHSWRPRSARIDKAAEIFRSQSLFWRNNGDRMRGAVEVLLE